MSVATMLLRLQSIVTLPLPRLYRPLRLLLLLLRPRTWELRQPRWDRVRRNDFMRLSVCLSVTQKPVTIMRRVHCVSIVYCVSPSVYLFVLRSVSARVCPVAASAPAAHATPSALSLMAAALSVDLSARCQSPSCCCYFLVVAVKLVSAGSCLFVS